MKSAVICQVRLTHYRTKFFDLLKVACEQRGIALQLVYGQPPARDLVRQDQGDLPWAQRVRNRFFKFGPWDIVWQPAPAVVDVADLVVITQENRIVSNYPLLFSRLWSRRKVAYWGHGVNFQSDAPSGLREKWKQMMLKRVDWWFAYTEMTVDILRRADYPAQRITCLNNAIDNEAFERDLASVTDAQLRAMRVELDVTEGAPVGLFCGSLYPDKKLDLLVTAGDQIHKVIPGFRLVVIGDGPSAKDIQSAAASRPWLKCVGVQKGRAKAVYFRVADLVLNPGLVGLHVLDSFCAGVPMITTAAARHSPEIAYLRNGVNGLVVNGGADAYANAVIELLRDKDRLAALKQAALLDARSFTLDNMVNRFADGIERCLAMPPKGKWA